ncbi:MAG: 3TM-type holin [Minisyncoccia bacterium]
MFEIIIGKILSSTFIAPILNFVLGLQKNKLDAIGSHEAQVEALSVRALQLDQREAEVNAAVVVAEQGNWITRWVRPAFAFPFVVFTWKIVIWDKVLGSWTHGSTDPLDPNMWNVFMAVVIAYFGGRSAEKVANTVRDIFKK